MISIKPTISNIILSDKDKKFTLDITVEGPDADKAVLRFKASTGKVKEVKKSRKRNTAPNTFPMKKSGTQIVLITVSDQRNPQENIWKRRISAYSKLKLPVDAIPNAKVQLEIAGEKTKTITTNSQGKATFDALVPPNVEKAELITLEPEAREDEIDLEIPLQRRMVFIPPPRSIPCDQPITVRYFALDTAGNPDSNNKTTVTSNVGSLSTPKHVGNGV